MWTPEIPKAEGWYWLFGWDFGRDKYLKARLHTVKVNEIRNGFAYVCDGHFIYPPKVDGLWCSMDVPEIPDEEDIP